MGEPSFRPTDTDRAVHEMRALLTVIHAHTQLSRRWMQRHQFISVDREIARLEQVAGFVRQMERQLAALERPDPPA